MELSELMPKSKKTTAILACGGMGTRMGENKLLINLCGKSVIRRSAEAVLSSRDVIGLVVAAPKELWPVYSRELDGLGAEFAEAGSTRSESVRSAFSKVTGDIVLIHDGEPLYRSHAADLFNGALRLCALGGERGFHRRRPAS